MIKSCIVSLALVLIATLVIGCGAGHPTIQSVTVTPSTASAASSSQGTVGFTATGNFSNHQSRMLVLADGLSWQSSNIPVASINSLGMATCNIPGTATITATAPANMQFTIGSGVSKISITIRGTAMLTCT